MITLFNEILYRPLFNLVVLLYNIIPGSDFGLAIITLTLLTRVVLLPLTIKTIRSQKALNSLGPKIKEVKEKYKNDTQAQSAAIMKLYKDNNINPVAGCLPLLIQLPILLALYKAFIAGLSPENLNLLYGFMQNPGHINNISLGFIDLTKSNKILVIIAGVSQFFQMRYSFTQNKDNSNKETSALNKQMLYFFPLIIIIIGWSFPAGLMIYWIAATVFSFLEQLYLNKKN